MTDHDEHLRGRCAAGGKHECTTAIPFVDATGKAQYGADGVSLPGALKRHGCAKCEVLAPNPDLEVRFYRAAGRWGFLSNLHKCEVAFEGRLFQSSEHAYQFGKPTDEKVAKWIAAAPYPRFAAFAGHALNPMWGEVVPGWNEMKVDRMRRVLVAKFTQNPMLAGGLLETVDKTLIEDSKTDNFWGIGPNMTGRNQLGLLLMELRGRLLAVGKYATLGEALDSLVEGST